MNHLLALSENKSLYEQDCSPGHNYQSCFELGPGNGFVVHGEEKDLPKKDLEAGTVFEVSIEGHVLLSKGILSTDKIRIVSKHTTGCS